MSEIIQHIQEKFKNDASALLQSLASHPLQFSYDSNGILSIFGTKYPGNCTFHPFQYRKSFNNFSFVTGSSIFEILPLTFYSIGRKEKDIIGVDKWLQLLKKFDLMDFVKNHSLKMKAPEKEIQNWYYLGPTS